MEEPAREGNPAAPAGRPEFAFFDAALGGRPGLGHLGKAPAVGAFGLEQRSAAHFSRCLVAPLKQYIRKGVTTGVGMGFGQFVILGGAGLAYYVGGQLYQAGKATFSEIMAVILCVMFGAVGLGQFAADASDKAEASAAAAGLTAATLRLACGEGTGVSVSPGQVWGR